MREARTRSNRRYVCLDPEEGKHIYDYYIGMLVEQKVQDFEAHLLFCFHCQESIYELDSVVKILKAHNTHAYGRGSSELPDSVVSNGFVGEESVPSGDGIE